MGKDKLRKFAENLTFDCLIQPDFEDIFHKEHPLKGRWHKEFFGNDNPIIVELGCGKGEYTIALAEANPHINYIGIDIKGARMWRGAKQATTNEMNNVGFLRTRIEFINSFFAPGEIDEIWITFPDPQLKRRRAKKRLTAPLFLARYAQMLTPQGVINLKSDSKHLYQYTQAVISHFELNLIESNDDIYGSGYADQTLSVKTAYEELFLSRNLPITYTRFNLNGRVEFTDFEWSEDEKLKEDKDNEEERIGLPKAPTTSGYL